MEGLKAYNMKMLGYIIHNRLEYHMWTSCTQDNDAGRGGIGVMCLIAIYIRKASVQEVLMPCSTGSSFQRELLYLIHTLIVTL